MHEFMGFFSLKKIIDVPNIHGVIIFVCFTSHCCATLINKKKQSKMSCFLAKSVYPIAQGMYENMNAYPHPYFELASEQDKSNLFFLKYNFFLNRIDIKRNFGEILFFFFIGNSFLFMRFINQGYNFFKSRFLRGGNPLSLFTAGTAIKVISCHHWQYQG